MARLGFIIDYVGRLQTFIFILMIPAWLAADWRAGLRIVALTAVVWFGSRLGRYLLARHAIDPVLQMPLSWW